MSSGASSPNLGTNLSCRRCGEHGVREVIVGVPDRLHGLGGAFTYVRCEHCGLLQLSATPDDLWGRHYREYGRHADESRIYAAGRKLITGNCYPWPEGPGRLLDIGCGNGWYLKDMSERGWESVGFEPDPKHAAAVARRIGLPVHSQTAELPRESFDLVTLNFSLEHTDDPRSVLQLAWDSCRPGGRVTVSLPDPESREAKLFGRYWFHLDAPRHLVLFTRAQIAEVMREMGFEVQAVRDLTAATGFPGSVSYRLTGKFNPVLWYLLVIPGMLFSQVVRDGLFLVEAIKPARPVVL